MELKLTIEEMEAFIESIVDAVEYTDDRDEQFAIVKTVLNNYGIVEQK